MKANDSHKNMPMTLLEDLLKHYLSFRSDIRDHVLTSQEQTDYIAWMAQSYGQTPDMTVSKLPIPPISPYLSGLADRLLTDPTDAQARSLLFGNPEKQQEEQQFFAGHDISIGRILRYMPPHWYANDYFEIYYAVSGTCRIYFPDETIELKPGSVLVAAPSVLHANSCLSDDSILVYYMVRSSTFDQVFWNQLPPDSLMATFFRQALSGEHPASYLHFETREDEDIYHLLRQIQREYDQSESYRSQMLNTLMSTFFILLLRRYEGTVRLPRTKDFYWKHEFSAILSHIQTHYSTVSQTELAERFHYSPRQISRIVQRCTGMTYNQLIRKLRMEKAALLLRQQNTSIEAISATVGYSTLSSFYRAFTEHYGCTPAEYAKE